MISKRQPSTLPFVSFSHEKGLMEEITDQTESIDTTMFVSARSYPQISEGRKKLIKKMNMREVLKVKLGKPLSNIMRNYEENTEISQILL